MGARIRYATILDNDRTLAERLPVTSDTARRWGGGTASGGSHVARGQPVGVILLSHPCLPSYAQQQRVDGDE